MAKGKLHHLCLDPLVWFALSLAFTMLFTLPTSKIFLQKNCGNYPEKAQEPR